MERRQDPPQDRDEGLRTPAAITALIGGLFGSILVFTLGLLGGSVRDLALRLVPSSLIDHHFGLDEALILASFGGLYGLALTAVLHWSVTRLRRGCDKSGGGGRGH